jgi:hypothetical protein
MTVAIGGELKGPFEIMPPDNVERALKIQFNVSTDAKKGAEESKQVDHSILAADDAVSFGFFQVDLLKWQDSNHECVLFSNEQHAVRYNVHVCVDASIRIFAFRVRR